MNGLARREGLGARRGRFAQLGQAHARPNTRVDEMGQAISRPRKSDPALAFENACQHHGQARIAGVVGKTSHGRRSQLGLEARVHGRA